MKISIIPDKIKDESYSEKWGKFLKDRGVEVVFVNFSDPFFFEKIQKTNGVMWRPAHNPDDKQKANRFIYLVDKILQKPIFPNFNTYWHYDDKVAQFFLFKALDIPTPKTWLFWNKDMALKWVEKTNYPIIHKLAVGASSENVILVNSISEAKNQIETDFKGIIPGKKFPIKTLLINKHLKQIIKRFSMSVNYFLRGYFPSFPEHSWQVEKNYTYFQEFLPNNFFDTRVTVIGKRAFAFRRWNRKDDFRASGSGMIDYDSSNIDKEMIRMAFDFSEKGQFQTMAYDFLYKSNKPVVSEISYTFQDEAVFRCPGHWDSKMNWHEGHMWPEEAQVEDFIIKLKKIYNS